MSAVALHQPETQRRSVIVAMADQYGMRADAFEATLRATVVPKACTREEFAAFCLVAKEYRLNPVLREIYAIPKKGGGIQPVVGVDGWYHLANDHPQFDGIEFEDELNDNGEVVAIICRIFRKDRSRPIEIKEVMAECKQPTEPWRNMPRRMLRHKAAIQCARAAFGFSGIVDPDEAERFTQIESAGQSVAAIHAKASRKLQTIDAHPDEFGPSEDFGADIPPPAAETPADPPAGAPASSDPATDDAGPSQAELKAEAYEAGRAACEAGVDFKDIPEKYRNHAYQRKAWKDGYQAFAAEAGA